MDICEQSCKSQRNKSVKTQQILEGIATVLIGILSAFVLPTDLASASFLTEEERAFASGF
jgi:hypothetical protein